MASSKSHCERVNLDSLRAHPSPLHSQQGSEKFERWKLGLVPNHHWDPGRSLDHRFQSTCISRTEKGQGRTQKARRDGECMQATQNWHEASGSKQLFPTSIPGCFQQCSPYARWQSEGGDPCCLENSVNREEKRVGFSQTLRTDSSLIQLPDSLDLIAPHKHHFSFLFICSGTQPPTGRLIFSQCVEQLRPKQPDICLWQRLSAVWSKGK